jgi:predicted O-methyltransferase YrrM
VLVEVGAWKGLSASHAGPICNARGVRFVLVDHFRGSRDGYAELYRQALAREDVRGVLEANLGALGIRFELLAMESTEAARRFEPGSIDAVFLDASHDGASVRADLEAWRPAIRRGGVLCGHDFSADHPELVRELEAFALREGLATLRGPDRIWWARL